MDLDPTVDLRFLSGIGFPVDPTNFLVDPRMDLVGADTIPLIAKKENLIPILHKSNLILRVA